jgi:hypothetical protein
VKISDLQKALAIAVEKRIARFGFSRSGYGFYKKFCEGKLLVNLGFIPHPADLDVVLHVDVRFDKLHRLLYADDPTLSPAMKRKMATLGAELGNIIEWVPHRWTVVELADIEYVADSIIKLFEAIGLPYLTTYSEMENALAGLSQDNKEADLLMAFDNVRAERALGLAFLLGDKDRFLRLAEAKTKVLTERKSYGLDRFLKLKDRLTKAMY